MQMTNPQAHFGPKVANRLFSMSVPDIDAIVFSIAMLAD
jgi:hypothetical protein